MSRNFAETISVSTSPAAYPLLAIVTATFDSDGAMDRWGLTLQGSDAPHEQSVKNRDTLMHILKSPCRAEISGGDHFGASWSGPTTLRIWDRDYLWILTPRRARGFRNAIHMAIGRFAEQMKPKLEPGLGWADCTPSTCRRHPRPRAPPNWSGRTPSCAVRTTACSRW